MKERLIDYWESSGIVKDKRVIDAFRRFNREDFLTEDELDSAYEDTPLPIGYGQTISQPTTIVIMLEALQIKKDNIVLEIGTGSGFNAALISHLAKKVITIEPVPELVGFAQKNLRKAGVDNVKVLLGDGSVGYPKGGSARYDRIILTCAVPRVPTPLERQLKKYGVIVAPAGSRDYQSMLVGMKDKTGRINYHTIGTFRFVPLIGKHGYVDPVS